MDAFSAVIFNANQLQGLHVMKYEFHQPVMEREAVEFLITRRDGIYVDCTLGGGGHSVLFLENTLPDAFLVGVDADADAIKQASQKLKQFQNTYLRNAFYDQLEVILFEAGKYPVDGVFYDLGISSFQIDEKQRGFTFQEDAPLDMRFDQKQKKSAKEVLNTYSQEALEQIIKEYGEERHWRAMAREVVSERDLAPLGSTRDLVRIVKSVVGERFLNKSLARVFQAIRIEVNQELRRLQNSLEAAYKMLKKGGRLVVISYHSLEDRIVKTFIREKSRSCVCPPEFPACVCDKVQELMPVTRKPVTPSRNEIENNSRARSAKLRAAEKVVAF